MPTRTQVVLTGRMRMGDSLSHEGRWFVFVSYFNKQQVSLVELEENDVYAGV